MKKSLNPGKALLISFAFLASCLPLFAESNYDSLVEKAAAFETEGKYASAYFTYAKACYQNESSDNYKAALDSEKRIYDLIAAGNPGTKDYDDFNEQELWEKLVADYGEYCSTAGDFVFSYECNNREPDPATRTYTYNFFIKFAKGEQASKLIDLINRSTRKYSSWPSNESLYKKYNSKATLHEYIIPKERDDVDYIYPTNLIPFGTTVYYNSAYDRTQFEIKFVIKDADNKILFTSEDLLIGQIDTGAFRRESFPHSIIEVKGIPPQAAKLLDSKTAVLELTSVKLLQQKFTGEQYKILDGKKITVAEARRNAIDMGATSEACDILYGRDFSRVIEYKPTYQVKFNSSIISKVDVTGGCKFYNPDNENYIGKLRTKVASLEKIAALEERNNVYVRKNSNYYLLTTSNVAAKNDIEKYAVANVLSEKAGLKPYYFQKVNNQLTSDITQWNYLDAKTFIDAAADGYFTGGFYRDDKYLINPESVKTLEEKFRSIGYVEYFNPEKSMEESINLGGDTYYLKALTEVPEEVLSYKFTSELTKLIPKLKLISNYDRTYTKGSLRLSQYLDNDYSSKNYEFYSYSASDYETGKAKFDLYTPQMKTFCKKMTYNPFNKKVNKYYMNPPAIPEGTKFLKIYLKENTSNSAFFSTSKDYILIPVIDGSQTGKPDLEAIKALSEYTTGNSIIVTYSNDVNSLYFKLLLCKNTGEYSITNNASKELQQHMATLSMEYEDLLSNAVLYDNNEFSIPSWAWLQTGDYLKVYRHNVLVHDLSTRVY